MSSTPEPAPAPRAELPAAPDHSLGVALNGDGADFAVHAPHATAVDLCLLTMDADGAVVEETRIGMHGPSRGLWSAHVPGVGAGQRYGYRAYGPWNPHEGLLYNPHKLLLDPYARAMSTGGRPSTPTRSPTTWSLRPSRGGPHAWTRPAAPPSAWSPVTPSRWFRARASPASAPSSTRPTSRA